MVLQFHHPYSTNINYNKNNRRKAYKKHQQPERKVIDASAVALTPENRQFLEEIGFKVLV